MNFPHHRKAVLGFFINDRVTASDDRPSLFHNICPTPEDILQDLHIVSIGEGHQIHGHDGLAAHRIDIAKGVSSSNRTKRIWVIYHRREEIRCLNNGPRRIELIDGRVIGRTEAD